MKKFILSLLGIALQTVVLAQGNQNGGNINSGQWRTKGNAADTSEFIGTTNKQSLVIKSDNVKAMEIKPTGDVHFSRLGSTDGSKGLVIVDGDGRTERLGFTPNFTQVLTGQGIFTNIDQLTGMKLSGSNIVQTAAGNVGLGILNPTSKLSVFGDGSFTGELYTGAISISGFNGAQTRLSFAPTNGSSPNVLSLGNSSSAILRNSACYNTNPNSFVTQIPDQIQITSNYATSIDPNNVNLMGIGYDGANNFIESEGHRADGSTPSLLLNYYCGYDVKLCTGGSGGFVFTGSNVQIGGSSQPRDGNVALSIGSKGTTGIKMLDANNNTNFLVNSDGTAAFGGGGVVPTGYQMAVYGKIITKEVVVKLLPWPDYVFSKTYKLKDLLEEEKFIKMNGHLSNIPSAKEVEKNGVQIGNMVGKQMEKIEEHTLYLIEMKKEILEMKKEIEQLKKENTELKAAIKK